MPDGQIIGRVAVKVLPNTDGFRKEAERQLNAIEKTLKLTIATKVDMSGASREFLTELQKINQRNRILDSRKIRFHTTLSTAGIREEITKAVRKIQEQADQRKIKIKANLVAAIADLELDPKSLDRVRDQLEDFRKRNSPLKIYVHPEMVLGATTLIERRLDYLSRPRRVPLLPHVSSSAAANAAAALAALSGARVVTKYFRDLADQLGRLDKNIPMIGSLALAVAGLAGWGLTAASNLFTLSASLAQIGPAALVLPGIFGGIAIGLGVTIAAFKDFNKVIPGVATALHAMQDAISANFWSAAEAPIRNLVGTLLPQLDAGLRATATALGSYFGSLATSLTGAFDGVLAGMFADLTASIAIATGGTDAFAGIIRTLGEVGAGYLPRLAQWFVDITTRFDAFLAKAAGDGRLQGWIETGITNLAALGSVLANLGSILAGVARAAEAAGGSTLPMLADTLDRIATTVNGPVFQQALTGVFAAAHQAMSLIADTSGPAMTDLFLALSDSLTTILPLAGAAIGTLLSAVAAALAQPAFQGGLIALFTGIKTAVDGLVPAFGPLAVALGGLGSLIGTFAAQLGPTLATAFTAAAHAVLILAPAIGRLIPPLGQLLAALITSLAPVLTVAAHGFAALAPLLGVVVAALVPLAPVILVVAAAWKTYTTVLAVQAWITALAASNNAVVAWAGKQLLALGRVVAGWAASVGAAIASMASYLAASVATAVQSATAWAAAQVRTVASLAVTAGGFIAHGAVMLASMAATVAGVVAGWVVMAAQSLAQAARMAAAWLIAMGPIGLIIAAVIALVAIIIANWDTIKDVTVKVFQAVMDWIGQAWDWITSKVDAAVNTVKAVIAVAFAVIKTVITTYVTAWKLIITTVWDAIGAVVQGAVNRVKAAISGLASIAATVRGYFDLARAWATDRLSALVGVVKAVPGKVTRALGNLGSLLTGAGRNLIQGFIDGIKNMFGAVKGVLSDLTSKLTDWKGPDSLDRVLLVDAGQLIIEGFITGLESRYDAVRASLRGLTADIGGMAIDAPTINGVRAGRLTAQLAGALTAAAGEGGGTTKVLNYYAAPGSSLSAEEDLFTAAGRARMVGW